MKYIIILTIIVNIYAKNLDFLNAIQREWINNQKTPIKVGITQIPNQILKTKNGYQGFSIDLFKIISKKTHLKFKYIYFNTWDEVINAAKNKKIDIVFLAQKSPSRLFYLDFTDTVLIQQNKIIVNIHNDKFKNIQELQNKKVAVTKGSAIEEFLRYNYPRINLILTKGELESLKLLNSQKVDAAISEAVRASYYIKKYNLTNLIIANNLGYNYYLSIATVSNQKMLNVILDRVLLYSKKEIKALSLKWGYSKDKIVFFDKKTIIFISIVFIMILLFSLYLYLINKKLQKEITEKNEVLQRLKMMRNSRLNQMSEIISMIAHQWKQPLNTLALINQILKVKYKNHTLTDEDIKEFDINSKQQIDLMIRTINDFQNFFKIDEKKQKFDVMKVLKDSVNIIEIGLEKYKIKLNYYHLNEEYLSYGYPNALSQIILNILNNAKDALLENREFEDKKINIILSNNDDEIIIRIDDNAGGIPIDIIDKIFNPYFSTKKNKNGTGLGLYMAKLIIEEKMNGSIDVMNKKEGASFEIRLPVFKK